MNAKSKIVLDAELLDRIHAEVAKNDELREQNERLLNENKSLRAQIDRATLVEVIHVDGSRDDEARGWRGDADSFGALDGRFE